MGDTQKALWSFAQVMGVVLTVVLLAALWVRPTPTLTILWNVVIPILPAAFMVSPAIWRNVCPLATLNMLVGNRMGRRQLDEVGTRWFGTVGIVLLFVMVPARRFLFNVDGPILAITIVGVALLALLLGGVFSAKAGFCNALCPVLPVEKLYGQRPLLWAANPRCASCTHCTRRGCLDLAPEKSVANALGAGRTSGHWLLTPFGVFAAAFPGFIVGYYTTVDGPLASAGSVYLHVALWAGASLLSVAALALLIRQPAERVTIFIAALCVGLYYWFAATTIATAIGLPAWWVASVRVLSLALVGFWLLRAIRPAAISAKAPAA